MGLFGKPNVEKLKQKKDVRGLIKVLRSGERSLQYDAAAALKEVCDRSHVPLFRGLLLNDSSDKVRKEAARILGKIGDDSAIELLNTALGDAEWDVRDAAVEAMGEIGGERAVEALIRALDDDSEVVRHSAIWSLGRVSGTRAVAALNELIQHKKAKTRQDAVRALGLTGDERAIEPLTQALEDEDVEVRNQAAKALCRFGQPAADSLVKALRLRPPRDLRYEVKEEIIKILDAIGGSIAIKGWVAALPSFDAQDALRKIGRPAVPLLIETLKDESDSVRGAAAPVLGDIGDSAAIEPLASALNDEAESVRFQAAIALSKFGDGRAVKPLVAWFRDNDPRRPYFGDAAAALARFRDKRGTDAFEDFFQRHPSGNEFAADGADFPFSTPAYKCYERVRSIYLNMKEGRAGREEVT